MLNLDNLMFELNHYVTPELNEVILVVNLIHSENIQTKILFLKGFMYKLVQQWLLPFSIDLPSVCEKGQSQRAT